MKKTKTLLVVAALGITTFFGCKKSDSNSTPAYSMKATVGTSSYNAPNCIIATSAGFTVIEGLGGSSTAPTFPYVMMSISNWNGATGTFAFDSTTIDNYAEYLTSVTGGSFSNSGSVVITAVTSTTVSGTFSFTCTDGTVISGGTFTAKKS